MDASELILYFFKGLKAQAQAQAHAQAQARFLRSCCFIPVLRARLP